MVALPLAQPETRAPQIATQAATGSLVRPTLRFVPAAPVPHSKIVTPSPRPWVPILLIRGRRERDACAAAEGRVTTSAAVYSGSGPSTLTTGAPEPIRTSATSAGPSGVVPSRWINPQGMWT